MGALVTMADVARLAGVSVSTVSHVVNGTRKVSPHTRQAVLDAIRRTGYTQNTIARSLATASTRTIGLVMSAISNPYFGDLVHAIEDGARAAGYTLLLADSHEDPALELRTAQMLLGRRVDGLLLAPTADDQARTMRYLAQAAVPVVLVDRLASPQFDQVGPENVEATADLVTHLAEHGHRRIGFVSGLAGLSTTLEREEGYRLGLGRAGLSFEPALVVRGQSTAEPARAVMHRLLALRPPPTAVVVGNNHMTIGVMHALREAGLSVPTDVALAVYDDFEWADFFEPRLTAMAQPIQQIGSEAVRLLLERLQRPELPARTVRLAPQLMRRDSCGCRTDAAGPAATVPAWRGGGVR